MSRLGRIIKTARLGTESVLVHVGAGPREHGPAPEPEAAQPPTGAAPSHRPPEPAFEELHAQARARAMAVIGEARREAEEILNEARERAAAIRVEAYQEGFTQGHAEGTAQARREMEEAVRLVQAAATEARQIRDRIIANSERQVIELVLDAVRTVITTELDQNPKLVVDTVERAIKRAGSQQIVRVRVNPEDLETVRIAFADRAAPLEVTGDGQVSVGGCIIDTESGTIDARLEAQLGEVERTLLEMSDEG